MKEGQSKKVRKRFREVIIFMVCFLGSFTLNLAGIITNQSPASEVVTRFHMVLLVTLVIYGFVLLLRVLYYLISRFWIRR